MLLTAGHAYAAPAADGEVAVTQDGLRNKIATLDANKQLDAALKTKLLDAYQTALANLQAADTYKSQTKAYEQALKLAPAQIKTARKNIERLSAWSKNAKPESFDGVPTDELEQRQILERVKLADLNAQLRKIESDLSVQASRLPQIRREYAGLQEKFDAAAVGLRAPHIGEAKPESEARDLQLRTQQTAQLAEMKTLEAEALSNSPRVELMKAQSDLLNLQIKELAPSVSLLEEVLSERRQQEAEKIAAGAEQAERELAGKNQAIKDVTNDNTRFGRYLSDITDKIAQTGAEQEKTAERRAQIDKDFKSAEQKIDLAGLSPALGRILREQRRDLPGTRQLETRSQELQNETAEASVKLLEVEEKLKQLDDVNRELHALMRKHVDAAFSSRTDPARLQIQAELRMLLNNQKDLLNKLGASYSTYLRMLGDLDFAWQQMGGIAQDYARYLDKHLLWVPNSAPLNGSFFSGLYAALLWLFDPRNWLQTLSELGHELLLYPWLAICAIAGLAALFSLKRHARGKLGEIAKSVAKPYTDKFGYTLQAFGYSLLLVAPLPLSFYFTGWLLENGPGEFAHAMGEALYAASAPLFALQLFYELTYVQGIAALHLHWTESTRKLLHKTVARVRFIIVPAVFLTAMCGAQSDPAYSDSLGRLALISLLATLSVVFAKLLRFKGGAMEQHFFNYPRSWVTRLRYAWYPGLIATPVVISGFAMAGYYASALELQHKLIVSICLVLAVIVLHDLALRWLSLVNRKLGLIKARQKREADQAAKAAGERVEDTAAIPADILDIPTINAQTRQMLQIMLSIGLIVSLCIVWADILPALAILDNIVLWRQAQVVDGQEVVHAITLVNLLLAGFYAFIVVMALRNLPGMLEVLLVKQLEVQPGNRYAINQLARYILIGLGIIVVAGELGAEWQQIQWLAAALSVGLGFGLQEIFANLVSGIILLFERPIRVGDTVTVGDLTGKVSRIQMRATTILDPDHKELIIPNKTFITGQLVNWTLSDQMTRLVLQVGVVYGSDTELVHQVISDTVRATPRVLLEPEPTVNFIGFGETALNFSVQVFVKELADRAPVNHDLHMRIEHALRDAHLELACKVRNVVERILPVTAAAGTQ